MPYFIFASQAIKPRFECKPIYDIMSGVAKRMGVFDEFTEGRTQEEWLQWMYAQTVKQNNDPNLPSYDEPNLWISYGLIILNQAR